MISKIDKIELGHITQSINIDRIIDYMKTVEESLENIYIRINYLSEDLQIVYDRLESIEVKIDFLNNKER